ncbi:MAG: AAA family ATPase [Planctomycetota bacterium]
MIESIEFKNFKVLRDATLPLGPCTILVGPNGSGKTTVLQALEAASEKAKCSFRDIVAAEARKDEQAVVEIRFNWGEPQPGVSWRVQRDSNNRRSEGQDAQAVECDPIEIRRVIESIRVFSFDAEAIASPSRIVERADLDRSGSALAAVLFQLRDTEPERFEGISSELRGWLPEFERILFDTDSDDRKSIVLRTREGHHRIAATDLSQGTLLSLAMLTLAYLPEPPSLVALEEPDRGIHPRLLRHVKDAIHRLSHPEACGEEREPVQVIATTHCPYFLDLFKPEDIVIANRLGDDVRFERLSEQPYIDEVLGDAPLGEAWYTGVLGGVPSEP